MNSNEYLKANNIKDLFEALTDSLILNQPSDVVQHLQDSLEIVKIKGLEEFKYDNFHSTNSSAKKNNCIRRLFGQNTISEKTRCQGDDKNDSKIIIFLFAPGETRQIGLKLSELFDNFGYINMGNCLRKRIEKEAEKPISLWKVSKSLLHSGDLVPENVALNVLLDEMKLLSSKQVIIIDGYPKTEKQIRDFNDAIGEERILQVFMVDSYENDCRKALLKRYNIYSKNAEYDRVEISKKLTNYKTYTLPVLKYFEDNQKLVILGKDTNILNLFKTITDHLTAAVPEIIHQFRKKVTPINEIRNKLHATRQKVNDGEIKFHCTMSNILNNADQLYSINPARHRMYSLGKIPLVLIHGAPKSGKTTVAKYICRLLVGWYHCDFLLLYPFSVTPPSDHDSKVQCCEIHKQLQIISSFAAGIILENFPTSELQLRQFNDEVGQIDLQLFIDISENKISLRYLRSQNMKIETVNTKLTNDQGIILKPILEYYAKSITPVIRYFSDTGCSFNINGDQEVDKISEQCMAIMKSIFY